MIVLNLLSPERKEIFRWRQYTKKAILVGSRVFFILICLSAPLIAINIYLQGEIDVVNSSIDFYKKAEEINKTSSMEKSFEGINNALVKINKIGENQIIWTVVFEKITMIVPPNIQIFSLQVSSNGDFTIGGNAKTREDVRDFGVRLKNSSDFSKVETPPSNLTESNNVDFRFSGKIVLDNFKVSGDLKTKK